MAFEFQDLVINRRRDAQLQEQARAAQFRPQHPLVPVVLCNLAGEFEDANGDPVDARVEGDEIRVWARELAESQPAPYLNLRGVPPLGGMPCWAGYAEESQEREILGVNAANALVQREQLRDRHAREHEPGGYDPLHVYLRSIVPLRLTPLGGLVVQVAPLIYDNGGTLVTYPGTNSLSLAVSLPAAGLARYVLVYLDPADNTAKLSNGLTVTDGAFVPPLPAPASSMYPSAWVRLAGGQTTISEIRDIVDARLLLAAFGGGGNHPAPAWGQIVLLKQDSTVEVYSTMANAIAAADAGDTIKIGPGSYTCDNLSGGVNIVGPGMSLATLTQTNPANCLTITGSRYISGFTISVNISSGGSVALTTTSACVIDRVRVIGAGAGVTNGFSLAAGSLVLCEADVNGTAIDNTANTLFVYGGSFDGNVWDISTGSLTRLIAGPRLVNSSINSSSIVGLFHDANGHPRTVPMSTLYLADSSIIPPLSMTARSAAPVSPQNGHIYLDDGNNTATGLPAFRARISGAWVDLDTDTGGGGAPDDAQYYVAALHAGLSAEIVPTIDTFKVSKLVAPDGTPDPALDVDNVGNINIRGQMLSVGTQQIGSTVVADKFGNLYLKSLSGVVFEDDNATYINAPSSDTLDVQVGGASRIDLTTSGLRVGAANQRINAISSTIDNNNTSVPTGAAVFAHTNASAQVHGLPANVHVLGHREGAGRYVQHGTQSVSGRTLGAFSMGFDGSQTGTVTFAAAFSTTPVVTANVEAGVGIIGATLTSVGTTSFGWFGFGAAGSNKSGILHWIAIGT